VICYECPEEGIPCFGPGTFGFVGHLYYIVGTGDVGFGGKSSAVGELGHAVDVRDHDPVVGVDEEFHEPLVDGCGVEAAEQHEVSKNHESLDVVAVGFAKELADDAIDDWDASGGVVEGGRYRCGVCEEVGGTNGDGAVFVDAVHEFTPANYLADEAFQRVDWCSFGVGQGLSDDFLRGK